MFRSLIFAAVAALAAPAAARTLDIPVADQGLVAVEVNGVPLRLRVDPGANGLIVLNRKAAERAGLKEGVIDDELARAYGIEPVALDQETSAGTPIRAGAPSRLAAAKPRTSSLAQVGPIRARGTMAGGMLAVDGRRERRLFTWFDGAAVSGADGVISPGALPFERVTIGLSDQRGPQRRMTLRGEYRPVAGFVLRHKEQRQPMLVKLSLTEPRTIATAAAGAVIANALGGEWAGDSWLHPIVLNLQRPVRPLRLQRPMSVGGLKIPELLVRTRDHRGGYTLPPDSNVEADEIVVIARSGQPPRFTMVIGEDAVAGCSSLTFDRSDPSLILSCPR